MDSNCSRSKQPRASFALKSRINFVSLLIAPISQNTFVGCGCRNGSVFDTIKAVGIPCDARIDDTGTVDTVYVGCLAIVDALDVIVTFGTATDFDVADVKNSFGGFDAAEACITAEPFSIVEVMAIEFETHAELTTLALIVLAVVTDPLDVPAILYDDNDLVIFDDLDDLDEVDA